MDDDLLNDFEDEDLEMDDDELDGDDDFDFDFDDDDDFDEEGGGSGGGTKKIVMIGVAAILVISLIALLFFKFKNKSDSPDENIIEGTGQEEFDPYNYGDSGGETSGEEGGSDTPPAEDSLTEEELNEQIKQKREDELNQAIGIGIQDLSQVGDKIPSGTKNTAELVDKSPLQDFQSTDIPMFYDIDNIRYVEDYVTYTKYRTTTAPGVELYWLDGTYQGKRVIIPTSLGVFQNLTPSGVVPVDVEITTLVPSERGETPQQVVTGFYINLNNTGEK